MPSQKPLPKDKMYLLRQSEHGMVPSECTTHSLGWLFYRAKESVGEAILVLAAPKGTVGDPYVNVNKNPAPD